MLGVGRRILERLVSPNWLDDTLLYDCYLAVAHPRTARSLRRERRLFERLIAAAGGGLVFDIGANRGSKTALFARYATQVVGVEPGPASVDLMRRRFAHRPEITVVSKGVGSREGVAPFYMFDEDSCYNTFSPIWVEAHIENPSRENMQVKTVTDVPITTLDALVREFGRPCYIKIDVEGLELEVCRGLSEAVPLLSFECNCPEFKADGIAVVERLAALADIVEFNYSSSGIIETLLADRWLRPDEMIAILKRDGAGFHDIFCRSRSVG